MDLKFLYLFLSVGFLCSASATLFRPCRLNNYKCMSKELSRRSTCSPRSVGIFKRQFLSPDLQFVTPFFNASYVDHDIIYQNTENCYVSQFAESSKTGAVVISVTCPFLEMDTNRELIQHLPKQEDSIFNFRIKSMYPEITMTVNLKADKNFNLCTARVSTYLKELPKILVNPLNKQTGNALTKDLTNLYIYERESAYYRGIQLIREFINNVLCDFNCQSQMIYNF